VFAKYIYDEQIKVVVVAGNVARAVGLKNSYKISKRIFNTTRSFNFFFLYKGITKC